MPRGRLSLNFVLDEFVYYYYIVYYYLYCLLYYIIILNFIVLYLSMIWVLL